jgi:glycosyltransferase involved in cell wall biosynthesis
MTHAVRRWAAGVASAGADVVVAFEEGPMPPPNGGVRWMPVRHSGPTWRRAPTGLREVLADADLLVLHSGWVFHNVQAAFTARKMGIPYLLEPRGAYDPHIVRRKRLLKKAWWFGMERALVHNARAIHVFFDEERDHLRALGYRGPVVCAPNGVDPPSGATWDGGSGGYVLWLGRFDPEHKGLDLLLRGLKELPGADRPNVRLHGPDWRGRKSAILQLVDSLGLRPWVHVAEAVYGEVKRQLLIQARGFVYPSRWDACPNSVLEAVSLGIPTLVTPYPLGKHLAAHSAALLEDASPRPLAAGLRRLGTGRASEVGKQGMTLLRQRFGWDQVSREWFDQVRGIT